jgi:PHP family Zn ribbon phosphoesterase
MTKKPPQFFRGEIADGKSAKPPRTDRAIYQLPRRDKNGLPITIAVECVDGGGNVPRNATSFRKLAREIHVDLQAEFESVAAVAESVLDSLKALRPGEVEIEFGVELGGELGIPLVTKGEAKANFKVTLRWKQAGTGAAE